MNRELIGRPFPPEAIKQRKGAHGKTLSYVDVAAVIARLNQGCDGWNFEVVSHTVDADEVIVLGKLTADGQTKMHFGGTSITVDQNGRAVSIADDLKAAASDALKKCASLLGVALELYGGTSASAPAARTEHAAPRADDRLTSRQLAALQAACRRKGWSSTNLTALVDERYGKTNPQLLTRSEASSLISELSGTNGANGH